MGVQKQALLKHEVAKLADANIRNDGPVSRTFLSWMYPIVNKGRKGKLDQNELKMPGDQATEEAAKKFEAAWAVELKIKANGGKPSLLRALRKAFGVQVLIAGIWKTIWSVFVLVGAFYFVRSLVQYVSSRATNPNMYNDPDRAIANDGIGWILACTFFLDSVLVGVALQRMGDACVRVGIKIRSSLMTAVYRKTFALSSVHNEGAGNVVSLVSTDCGKLYEGVLHMHNVWTAPLEATAIIALLLSLTEGTYGLPALGIVVFVLPLQYYMGYRIAKYKLETVEVSDSRVLRMQEILLAIKLVKFYVWERSFAKQVTEVRRQEIQLLSKTAVVKTLNLCLVFAVPPVIALVIFATYVFNKGRFDSVFSFTVLSLFNTLRFPLVVLPKALRGTSEAIASLQRLEKFLLLDESTDHPQSKEVEVRFEDADLVYSGGKEEDFKLTIPKFEVKPGEVVAIVGRVGSGKSSVFQAILQNMDLKKGKMAVGGTVSYVPQTPWVQNLSLRDNILFGLPHDDIKYKQVIHACALELDLQILPNGDKSMAGERGINLSGGQRQRVGLARATYHDSELVLLDNPLSAVDQHTAIHIFNHCIRGMLRDKAVVWITHQLELLPQCDKIAIMEGGVMTYFGPYSPDVLNQRLPVDHLLFATVEAGDSAVKRSEPGTPADASSHGAGAAAAAVKEVHNHHVHGQPGPAAPSAGASHSPLAETSRDLQAGFKRNNRRSFQRSSLQGMKPVDSVVGALTELAKQEEEREREAEALQEAEEGGSARAGTQGGASQRVSHESAPMSRKVRVWAQKQASVASAAPVYAAATQGASSSGTGRLRWLWGSRGSSTSVRSELPLQRPSALSHALPPAMTPLAAAAVDASRAQSLPLMLSQLPSLMLLNPPPPAHTPAHSVAQFPSATPTCSISRTHSNVDMHRLGAQAQAGGLAQVGAVHEGVPRVHHPAEPPTQAGVRAQGQEGEGGPAPWGVERQQGLRPAPVVEVEVSGEDQKRVVVHVEGWKGGVGGDVSIMDSDTAVVCAVGQEPVTGKLVNWGSVIRGEAARRDDAKQASAPYNEDHGILSAFVTQTPEQIAAEFNGVAKRLSAGRAAYVYWKAGGLMFGLFSFFLFVIAQTCRIYSDLWIRWWADDKRYNLYPKFLAEGKSEDEASALYILCYLALVMCFILLLLSRDGIFSIWHIAGSTRLHNELFSRVLQAPILFFLRTPVGDVLNSFAKDQDTLDETLPDTIHMSTIYLMILLTSLAIVTVSIHYYAALTAALFGAFGVMQFLYLPAATTLKRWAGETASQVYVHVDESLHGMEVIKAFDAVNYFIQENIQRINVHHLALFNTEQCHLWLAFWCDFFGAVLVVATCLFSVGLKDELGSAAVGLAISNTIQVLVFFTWVVRGVADSVSMWDAVERVTSFATNIPEEASIASNLQQVESAMQLEALGGKPADATGMEMVQIKVDDGVGTDPKTLDKELAGWPSTGDIKFEKVCLRYYPGAPLALKFVSFHIQDCEKVGVVGRTGSGKTTLLMALFRMFELAYGRIVIDGKNIAKLPLREVRARLAIIPQEPVMFKGTVRSNLDPFGDATDAELWHALELVHMKEAVAELPGKLDAVVAEGGSNFSLGQKQLVCMGRCVLKNTRILVLDEATAAMDLQTDSLIQKTIRRVFKGRTTITIAHRLDTIIFSDKILAMASGELKEFDTPDALLRVPWSMFNKLVDDTGSHAAAALKRMAAEGPNDVEEEPVPTVREE